VRLGYRMTASVDIPDVIRFLMDKCWTLTPEKRPQFQDIIHKLQTSSNTNVVVANASIN